MTEISREEQRMRVAICGAGISGLAVAAFIQRANTSGISVDIYEAKEQLSSDGSGIAIWKRTWEILRLLGIEEECLSRGIPTPRDGQSTGPVFRRSDIVDQARDFHSQVVPYGPTFISRPQILEILQRKLDPDRCKLHFKKKITMYELQPTAEPGVDMVNIVFDDGTQATSHVLIGCDGVHSKVRATLFKDDPISSKAALSGQIVYRCHSSAAAAFPGDPNHWALTRTTGWCGDGRHVITNPHMNPLTQELQLSVVGFVRVSESEQAEVTEWATHVDPKELQDHFHPDQWEKDLVRVLKHCSAPTRWAVKIVQPLDCFVQGPVALVGDAAHAMTPHQGVGAGQGVEDAYILASVLTDEKTTTATIPNMLQLYNGARLHPAKRAAAKSDRLGELYDLVPMKRDGTDLNRIASSINEEFAWLGEDNVASDMERLQTKLTVLH